MQLWFAHGSEVTLRQQLVTQVILAILCDELAPGERLPSTRDLARRFRLHPNTVSAGYRQLERENWVELRHGSGVYVRQQRPDTSLAFPLPIDRLIAHLFRSARNLGVPLPSLHARLRHWLELQPPDRFLVIEPDEELRRIVMREIAQNVKLPVSGCDLLPQIPPELLVGAIPVALPSKLVRVRKALPANTELLPLHIRSIPGSLAAHLPAPASALIGVASRWPDFLTLAHTMLVASGFAPECIIVRDARKPNWQRGLRDVAAVISDSVTALELPSKPDLVRFPLLSDSSLADLRRYEEFVSAPIPPAL